MLELDTNVALLAEVDVLTNQLVGATIVPSNVRQVQALRYNFCGQGHANGNWVPKGITK